MNIKIYKSKLKGSFKAPPSKSYAHRAIIAAALANGTSHISNVDFSDDIKATIDCIKTLGATISKTGENAITITGIGNKIWQDNALEKEFFVNECGSTYRFFIPIALVFYKNVLFKGSQRLMARPITPYEDIFKERGIKYSLEKDRLKISGTLRAGTFVLQGDISSQFVTGLLYALPLLGEKSELALKKPIESLPYIYLTLDLLKKYGINVKIKDNEDEMHFKIGRDDKYTPFDYEIEGDYSNSAFFEAMAYTNDIAIKGLNENSIQGDKAYKEIFEKIRKGQFPIDISNVPDLAPVLFAFSALLGRGEFIGTKRLAIKESDRANAMKEELSKFGVSVKVGENSVVIDGKARDIEGVVVDPHGDHRIAMAMSVILLKTGGIIKNADCVNKSFPAFYDELEKLGCKLEKKYEY